MGKYTGLEDDIFSIFNSDLWKAEEIKTYPTNFIATNPEGGFIRIDIIAGGENSNTKSASGILMIEIFTSVGKGPRDASLIADKLDEFIQGKTLETNIGASTQFFLSTMVPKGVDKDIKTLFKSVYSISFKYNGVF